MGKCTNCIANWGDCQLPSIMAGAIRSVDGGYKIKNDIERKGLELFKLMAKTVMKLSSIKRQDPDDTQMMRILESLRGTGVDDNDAKFLSR